MTSCPFPPLLRTIAPATFLLIALVGGGGTSAYAQPATDTTDVRPLVVKIHTTQRFPDVLRPWTQQEAQKISGSGVIISGQRILTNAHVVRNASEIYVQPYQSSDMLEARVIAFSPWMDLAVIELEDPQFFAGRSYVEIDETIPNVKDTINVYGYPMGGDELSVTAGIVSRIEYAAYYFGQAGLRIQVDAALNPGNSGGPAIAGGKLVGLVFSGVPESQNIGYLIPAEEVMLFLNDISDGNYQGKPMLLDPMQTVENSALRAKLQLPRDKGGLMVISTYNDDEGRYPLHTWDVITQIGEYPLDSQGNVQITDNLRLYAKYLLQRLGSSGSVNCKVFRDGQEIDVTVPLRYDFNLVIPHLFDDRPRYFIYGPLVFSQATQELYRRLNDRGRQNFAHRGSSLVNRISDQPQFPGEELVIVSSRMFSHPITKGYDEPFLAILAEVNGVKVENLRHFVELLRDTKEKHMVLRFEGEGPQAVEIMVLDHAKMLEATEEVLDDNGIRSAASDDLAQVWSNKP